MEQLSDIPRTEVTLRVVRVVAPLATVAMAATVVVGLASAQHGAVAALLENAWGRVTILDLYLALGAVWTWIVWRERRATSAALWGLLLVGTGSIAVWGYIAWRARTARDVTELLLGPAEIGT